MTPLLNESLFAPSRARARLRQLERILPLAILMVVLGYELVFEFLFAERIGSLVRFFLEVTVFGGVGALVTWFTLGWLRRHLEQEAAYARAATQRDRLLATITMDSADAIFMLDTAGLIQTWNRSAELLFHYTASEIIGKPFQILLPKALLARGEVEQLNQALAGRGSIRNRITQRVTKTGRMLTVELSRTLLYDDDGNVVGSSAILRDVTERERVQNQIREMNRRLEIQVTERTRKLSLANERLRQRQCELEKANSELEQLDSVKSEFVSLVSHELRAPLANISGSLQLLLTDPEAQTLTPSQREMMQLANEQTDRLTRLIKGVLDVARIQSGQMPLSLQAFDSSALLERNLEQWRTCDTDHTWVQSEMPNLPSVWGDPDRVEEVLMNLFDNAAKYSRRGGTIRVSAQVEENQLVVSVEDEGDGIAAAELEKIFDKFHRVERGDARETYGYGLGLYLSRKFIEAMGGKLWAQSDPGRGSCFCFALPLAGQTAKEVGARTLRAQEPKGRAPSLAEKGVFTCLPKF